MSPQAHPESRSFLASPLANGTRVTKWLAVSPINDRTHCEKGVSTWYVLGVLRQYDFLRTCTRVKGSNAKTSLREAFRSRPEQTCKATS